MAHEWIYSPKELTSFIIKIKRMKNAKMPFDLSLWYHSTTTKHRRKKLLAECKKNGKENQPNSINSQKNAHRSSLTFLFFFFCWWWCCDNDSVFIYACLHRFVLPFRFHFSHICVAALVKMIHTFGGLFFLLLVSMCVCVCACACC